MSVALPLLCGCVSGSTEWASEPEAAGSSTVKGGQSGSGAAGAGGADSTVGGSSAATGGSAGASASTFAGSSAAGGGSAGASSLPAIEPAELRVEAKPGGGGAFSLVALTLEQRPAALRLLVALRNDGEAPACSPAFSVDLLDRDEVSLGMSVGGLLVRDLYRLTSDPTNIAGCVAPGAVAMAALDDWPELTLADVNQVVYWLNYWVLDVTPLAGLSIEDVEPKDRDGGVAYTGSLVNALDVPVDKPGVAIFPLAASGRPIDVAWAHSDEALAPSGRWRFETAVIAGRGGDFAAYLAGGP